MNDTHGIAVHATTPSVYVRYNGAVLKFNDVVLKFNDVVLKFNDVVLKLCPESMTHGINFSKIFLIFS